MVTRLVPCYPRGANLFDLVRREMDDVVERFTDWRDDRGGKWFTPRADVVETELAFEVSLDAPGMTASDFGVELIDGELAVTGKREEVLEDKTKRYHHVERHSGQFRRTFHLGHEVNADSVEAIYKDGVLHVTVPKSAKVQPKKIEIKS